MRKFLTVVTLSATTLVALTGCIKYDGDLTVTDHDTVDGSFIIGADKDALAAMGQTANDLFKPEGGKDAPLKGATATNYEDDTFVGKKYTFEDASFEELKGEPGHELNFAHQDGQITFDGSIELAKDDTETVMYKNAEVKFEVTFPGKVIKTNGKVHGNTVTWTGDTKGLDMTATADDGKGSPFATVALWFAAIALVTAGAMLVRRLKSRKSAARQSAGDPEGGPEAPETISADAKDQPTI